MNATLFWGILLIVLGLSFILKTVFHFEFSVFRVIIAFALIYLGIRLFIGKDFSFFPEATKDTETVFSEKTIHKLENGKEYNVIFGSARYDLRDIPLADSTPIRVKINTIFGGSQLLIRPDMAIQIKANTAFGGTKMPDGNTSAFGTLDYVSDSAKINKPKIILETNTVFGGTVIKKTNTPDWE